MVSRTMRVILASATCLTGIASAVPALASDTPATQNQDSLDDIVVTAQRREESLQKVPVSVTALTAHDLEKAQVETLEDYAALVPSFKATSSGAPGESQVSIRGISNIGGQSSSIAFYNDGFGVDRFDFDLDDVERIEVLRGPQGTLFGRNTIAGAVNIVYNKPVDRLAAAGSFQAASYDSYKAFGMINLPLIGDTLMLRSSLSYAWSDGYLRNLGPSGDSDGYERISGRVALRGKFDRLTIDASLAISDNKQELPTAVPSGVTSSAVQGVGFPSGIDDGQGFFPGNTRTVSTDVPTHFNYRYNTAILNGSYDLGGAKVVIIAGRQKQWTSNSGDFDRTADNYILSNQRLESTTYGLEARVESTTDGQWSWLIGGSYGQEDSDTRVVSIFTLDFLGAIGFPTGFGPFHIDDNSSDFSKRTLATFGQIGWKTPDEKLSVELSARYTSDKLRLNLNDDAQVLATPIRFSGSHIYDDVTPKISVSYRPSENVTFYGTISRGYKSGGFNTAASQVPGAPVSYGKETAINYEAGVKSELLDRHLRINASGFLLKWKDIQVNSLYQDPSLAFYSFTQNAASATIKGGEIEIVALPVKGLELRASAAYNDATFDKFDTAIDRNGNVFDASGNRVPFSSKWQGSFSGDYSIPVGTGSVFTRIEYNWVSDFYQSTDNRRDIGYYIGDRGTLNLRAGWRADKYSVTLFAENLGGDDKVYLWEVGNYLSGYQAVVRPERFGVRLAAFF